MNRLILGDNLAVLKSMPSESVDLIYLDPPFFSNKNYECIWGDDGEIRSFNDRWAGGIEHYIGWLKERVQEMHRVLKPTGSIYLHCDHHANAYIRVYILDPIFGAGNFRNEIVWCYERARPAEKQFKKVHDTILLYSKSEQWTFNVQRVPSVRVRKPVKRPDGTYSPVKGDPNTKICPDWWTDISSFGTVMNAKDRIGYPTQKPEALLERIIKASSNEGDIVLDPFVGGGTTIAVANKLNRQWIGIDQSVAAITVSQHRIANQGDLFTEPFEVIRHVYDYDDLFTGDPFQFENWIVSMFGGVPNIKQRGDMGIDGRHSDGTPIQVKQSENIGRNVIDNLRSAAERYDSRLFSEHRDNGNPVAYLIAFSFSRGAIAEVARLKLEHNVIIELVRVDRIVSIAYKPKVSIEHIVKPLDNGKFEIAMKAVVESDCGIALFSWDWDYEGKFKPEVMIDHVGEQTLTLDAGTYNLAVRATDNAGLSNIASITVVVP